MELVVLAGVSDVGGGVDVAQPAHEGVGDGAGGDFQVEFALKVVEGLGDEQFDLFAVAGALGEGLAESFEELVFIEGFLGAVAFEDDEVVAEDLFERAETVFAGVALASSSDVGAASGAAGVHDLGVVGGASGAAHC